MGASFGHSPEQMLDRALGGDRGALSDLLDRLTPVVQACVARALLSRAAGRGRDVRQEVEDMVQEVFVRLLVDDAKALRAWDPERGLSLKNFVALLAGRHVASIMRARRRNPWSEQPVEDPALHALAQDRCDGGQDVEQQVLTHEMLEYLLLRLEEELSPLGYQLFELLFVKEREVTEVCQALNMTPNAVYAWRSRLIKLSQRLKEEVTGQATEATGKLSEKQPPRRNHLHVSGLVLCLLPGKLAVAVLEVLG